MNETLESLISEYVRVHSENELKDRIKNLLAQDDGRVLTIIVNKGQHPVSDCHLRGEVFVVSEGVLDFTDPNKVFKELLGKLAIKLKSKPWNRVYVVPFGPSVLSMQVKLLVYRILHIDSIDVLHVGNNNYVDIEVDQRNFLSEVNLIERA